MDNVLTLNGNMLTFGGNAITVVDTGIVTIGGKNYTSAILPDGHRWLTLNLDLTWTGLQVGTPFPDPRDEVPAAAYYDNDETTYGWGGLKYGLMYTYDAIVYLYQNAATLTPGWHIATNTEWNELKTLLSDQYGYGSGLKTKSTTGWKDNGNGNGNTPLDVRPSGRCRAGVFEKAGEMAEIVGLAGDPARNAPSYHQWEYDSSRIVTGGMRVLNGDALYVRLVEDYV